MPLHGLQGLTTDISDFTPWLVTSFKKNLVTRVVGALGFMEGKGGEENSVFMELIGGRSLGTPAKGGKSH